MLFYFETIKLLNDQKIRLTKKINQSFQTIFLLLNFCCYTFEKRSSGYILLLEEKGRIRKYFSYVN